MTSSEEVKKIAGWLPKVWIASSIAVLTLIIIVIFNVFNSNSTANTSWLFIIGLAGIGFGGFLLYQKNDSGKWVMSIGIVLLLLSLAGGWIGYQNINQAGDRLGAYVATGNNTNNLSQNIVPEKYMGLANGFYTLTNQTWLVFEWPDDHCVVADNKSPVLDRGDDRGDIYKFLSRSPTQQVEVRTLALGESWDNFTCH